MRAMTGVKAPLPACEPIVQRAGKIFGAFAIARKVRRARRASGSTEARAAAASAQFVSMIGKAPAAAQRVDDIRRRIIGNDDKRTLQRHGVNDVSFRCGPQACQSAINGAVNGRARL